MSYFVIEDFRRGLDRRKHILTLPPGALYTAKNCNINRGGEIEASKDFVPTFNLPANTFGMVSAGGQLYVFGSAVAPALPAGVLYQRLQHPDGLAMTDMVWVSVNTGKVYAIAAFTGGVIASFFDGALITDWASGAVGGTMSSNADIASHFAAIINTDPNYSAVSVGVICTITGLPGVAFAASASAVNGGAVDNQTASVGLSQAAVAGTLETTAHATVTITGAAGGSTLTSLSVNGVDILGATVNNPGTDNGFAALIAAQINSFTSAPDYTATFVGNVVTVHAVAGTGATPNGFVLTKAGTVGGAAALTNMAGGVTAVAGVPQISTVSIGGTFEGGDIFTVTLGTTVFGGMAGTAGEQATAAIILRSKTYAIAGPNLFGSAVGDPTEWNSGTGSFVEDMSSNSAGAERLTALGLFLNNLAVFARNTIQIMAVDPDPANNDLLQVLENIGTLAPKSVTPFGDVDLFFLADTGVRSLKVRVNTTTAALSDIGSPIDPLIIAAIKTAGGNASKSVGVIEPIDSRYLLQIGTITYAFSFFPDAKVAGWSTYETGLSITDFSIVSQRVYARAGDVIYLLGGPTNDTYTSKAPDIKIPFLSAHQIATLKHFTGVDVACDGVFDIYLSTDPNNPDAEEIFGTVNNSTYGLGKFPIDGEDTSVISLHFVGKPGKFSKIANAVVHYEPLEETA